MVSYKPKDHAVISGKVELDFDEHEMLDDVLIGGSGGVLSVMSHMDISDGDEIEVTINVKRRAKKEV